jgi:hypothetical protein
METDANSRVSYNISFGVPSRGALLYSSIMTPLLMPGSPLDIKGALWRERCPYPEPFLTYLPSSPVKEPSQRPSTLSFFRDRSSIPSAPYIHLTKAQVHYPPSRFPN